jgi:hypothetical protein
MGAIQAAKEFFWNLFCGRSRKVAPSSAPDDTFTQAWVQSCAAKAAQASPAGSASAHASTDSLVSEKSVPASAAPSPLPAGEAMIAAVHAKETAAGLQLLCPSTSMPSTATTPQPYEHASAASGTPAGHVSSIIQKFETLSPRKQKEGAASVSVVQLHADGSMAAGALMCCTEVPLRLQICYPWCCDELCW